MRAEERLRICFEELGPTFIKLGQLLASRPDLIPPSFADELKKLHDQVETVPFEKIKPILEEHYGSSLEEVFLEFNEEPIGAASIAQVYEAKLKNNDEVVVKVLRPRTVEIIYDDIGVIYNIAELLDRYVPESRVFNPIGIVEEFFKALGLETNFFVEANNIRRFKINFKDVEDLVIPKVYSEFSGEAVLVMEKLNGIPLSNEHALNQEGTDREAIIRLGIQCYFKMVFKDGLFHGDLHPGNMFVMPGNKLGLIDFGIVGRLNSKTKTAIANMLVALATEDYDRLAFEYIDLAPYSDFVDLDKFSRQIRDTLAPYYGLTMKEVNSGKLLLDSASIAAKNKIMLPSELILFFKSNIAIESIGRNIMDDFDVLDYALDFATEIVQAKYDPAKISKDLSIAVRDISSLMVILPKQLKQIVRRWNSPEHMLGVEIKELGRLNKTIANASNLLFLAVIIGCLLLSASMLMSLQDYSSFLIDIPASSLTLYGMAFFLSFFAFYNYIKK